MFGRSSNAHLKVQTLLVSPTARQVQARLSRWWAQAMVQFLAFTCWQLTTSSNCWAATLTTACKLAFMRSIVASCTIYWTKESFFNAERMARRKSRFRAYKRCKYRLLNRSCRLWRKDYKNVRVAKLVPMLTLLVLMLYSNWDFALVATLTTSLVKWALLIWQAVSDNLRLGTLQAKSQLISTKVCSRYVRW